MALHTRVGDLLEIDVPIVLAMGAASTPQLADAEMLREIPSGAEETLRRAGALLRG